MQYDLLDPAIRHSRQHELSILHAELESHLDPAREIHAARMRCFYEQKAAALHAQGKHHEADQWLMPKEKWERPSNCSEADWANIIKPFDRRTYEYFDKFLAEWNWHVSASSQMDVQQKRHFKLIKMMRIPRSRKRYNKVQVQTNCNY